MTKNKQTGHKKLSRQYAIMVFVVLMITILVVCFLVRMKGIDIYLSANNDMISEILRKEKAAFDKDNYNPSASWNFDYWKEHYTEFSTNEEKFKNEYTEEEIEHFYELAEQLDEDPDNVAKNLNALPAEEQLGYARFQYYSLMILFGRKTDYYGYEGCSCFIDLGNGKYMVLADQEDRKSVV